MIRLFQAWRAARRKKMCDLVAQIWVECEAELAEEIERSRVLAEGLAEEYDIPLDEAVAKLRDALFGDHPPVVRMFAEEENDA